MTTALLSERILLEVAEHEGLVLEAYKCSAGVLTWGFGVTNASGHNVDRYDTTRLGHRSSIERAVEVFEWLLRTKYLPEVRRAFRGRDLTESQTAGALSFHWNTGAIGQADWVQSFLLGRRERAWSEFMNWSKPKEILDRRKAERALFFDGRWSQDGVVLMYDRVNPKEPRNPVWRSAREIYIRDEVRVALRKAGAA
ncbi:lysozyme [Porphyrobacter sp. YT40]|uniref:lysozyme n=1 Tax=Porphyrobacter sp. YT40 TaxID=2547601 RepID=UPI001143955A|nr:lysozyme [Porphyrobacter sp. YT40]QDH35832.1 lysozyme [Porphyrobacter sp. YT40]